MNLPSSVHSPIKQRFTAFFLHLGTSLAVFIALFFVIYLVWFPHALIEATGGTDGLAIVVAVDLVLGPLLTLVVYDISKSKRHLIRDISSILILQLSCLFGGVYIVHQSKPIAIVHVYDTFHVFRKDDFKALDIDWAPLREFPGGYPKLLYVRAEENEPAQISKGILDMLNKKRPQQLRLDLYEEMPHDSTQITAILQTNIESNNPDCITQNITSVYKSGSICFHPSTFIFTDFKSSDPTPHLK